MKRMLINILLAVLCATGLAGCGKSEETVQKQLELRSQGMQFQLDGEYEAAINSYNEALQLSGMSVSNLELDIASYKASAYHQKGDTQKAIETCSAVLDMEESAELYLTRGLLYRSLGDSASAKADFEEAVELTSEKDNLTLGRLYYYMEDYAQAKEYLEKASSDGDPEGIYWQAELYRQMGNEDYAVTLYKNYLNSENPIQMSAYEKVASWQIRQEEYEDAIETLQDGIARGDSASLQGLLAHEISLYEQIGDFETAKLKMESYLQQYPEDGAAAREYEFLKSR